MKLVFWIVGVPLLLVAAFFAVANHDTVAISLWPLGDAIAVPLFAAIIIPLYVGVIIGAVAAWLSAHGVRKRARQERRRADALQRETETLKQRLDTLEAARAEPRSVDGGPRNPALEPPASVLH